MLSRYSFHYGLTYGVLFGITGGLIFSNTLFTLYFYRIRRTNFTRGQLSLFFHVQIISDYLFLFFLVYFTGFVLNPFIFYFVFHVVLTAFIFPRRTVYVYVCALVSVFILVLIAESSQLLPSFRPIVHLSGSEEAGSSSLLPFFALVSTIVITGYLITSIMERVEERGQRVELELDHYKRLDQAKSSFILQVTHELRGPIAALRGYHEMILKGITGEIPDRTRQSLERANHRTQNLLNIIDEMLDYAYMKSEEDIKYELGQISISEILNYNIELYENLARQKSIKLNLSSPRRLYAWGGRDLLNIILGNLITNAVKYSPAETTVTIAAEEDGSEVHIMVKDEGMGIEAQELEKIFDEFHRTRRARSIEQDGTGLGLSIVQKAVNMLNGRITVYSEVDRGTNFHIYLPLHQESRTPRSVDADADVGV